jgi:hypothetical protein
VGVGRLLRMAEKGSCGLNFMRDSTGGVVVSNAKLVLSSGFVRLDDMSMGTLGMFSVINRLNDVGVSVISVVSRLNNMAAMVRGCCRGRGLDWVAASAVVGQDSFLGLRDTLSDHSSSCQCS